MGRTEEAAQLMLNSLQVSPNNTELFSGLGYIYRYAGGPSILDFGMRNSGFLNLDAVQIWLNHGRFSPDLFSGRKRSIRE